MLYLVVDCNSVRQHAGSMHLLFVLTGLCKIHSFSVVSGNTVFPLYLHFSSGVDALQNNTQLASASPAWSIWWAPLTAHYTTMFMEVSPFPFYLMLTIQSSRQVDFLYKHQIDQFHNIILEHMDYSLFFLTWKNGWKELFAASDPQRRQ